MKNNSNIFPSILLAIVTAALGFFANVGINKLNQKDENRPRVFDQFTSVEILNYRNAEENGFKLFHNGKQIHEYNNIWVRLFNYEDISFKDVRIYITIRAPQGDSLQLLASTINGNKEVIHPIKDSINSDKENLEFGYTIDIANQSTEYNQSIFDASFQIISSKKLEKPVITLYCQGLKSTPEQEENRWDRYNEQNASFSDTTFGGITILASFLILFVGFMFLLIKVGGLLSRTSDERKEKEDREEMVEYLGEKIANEKINTTDYKKIMEEYFIVEDAVDYEKASKFTRWIESKRKPKYKVSIKK